MGCRSPQQQDPHYMSTARIKEGDPGMGILKFFGVAFIYNGNCSRHDLGRFMCATAGRMNPPFLTSRA